MPRRPVSPFTGANPLAPAVTITDPFVAPRVQGPNLEAPAEFVAGLQAIAAVSGQVLGKRIQANQQAEQERLLGLAPQVNDAVGRKLSALGRKITTEDEVRAVNDVLEELGVTRYDSRLFLFRQIGRRLSGEALANVGSQSSLEGLAHPESGLGPNALDEALAEAKEEFRNGPLAQNKFIRAGFESNAGLLEADIRQRFGAVQARLEKGLAKQEAIDLVLQGTVDRPGGLLSVADASGAELDAIKTNFRAFVDEGYASGVGTHEEIAVSALEKGVVALRDEPDSQRALLDFILAQPLGPRGLVLEKADGKTLASTGLLERVSKVEANISRNEDEKDSQSLEDAGLAAANLVLLYQDAILEMQEERGGVASPSEVETLLSGLAQTEPFLEHIRKAPGVDRKARLDAMREAAGALQAEQQVNAAELERIGSMALEWRMNGVPVDEIRVRLGTGHSKADRDRLMAIVEGSDVYFEMRPGSGADRLLDDIQIQRKELADSGIDPSDLNRLYNKAIASLDDAARRPGLDQDGMRKLLAEKVGTLRTELDTRVGAYFTEETRNSRLSSRVEDLLKENRREEAKREIASAADVTKPGLDAADALIARYDVEQVERKKAVVEEVLTEVSVVFRATNKYDEDSNDPVKASSIPVNILTATRSAVTNKIAELGHIPTVEDMSAFVAGAVDEAVYTGEGALAPGETPDDARLAEQRRLQHARQAAQLAIRERNPAMVSPVFVEQLGLSMGRPESELPQEVVRATGVVRDFLAAGNVDQARTEVAKFLLLAPGFDKTELQSSLWMSNTLGNGLQALDDQLVVPVTMSLRADDPVWRRLGTLSDPEAGLNTALPREVLEYIDFNRRTTRPTTKYFEDSGIQVTHSLETGFTDIQHLTILVPLPDDLSIGRLTTIDPELSLEDFSRLDRVLGDNLLEENTTSRMDSSEALWHTFNRQQ